MITMDDVIEHLQSTKPIDHERVQFLVKSMYARSELAMPAIIPVTSPHHAQQCIHDFHLNPYSQALEILRVGLRNQVKDILRDRQQHHVEALAQSRMVTNQVTQLQNVPRSMLQFSWGPEANKGGINPWLMAGDMLWLHRAYELHEQEWGTPEDVLHTISCLYSLLQETHVLFLSDQVVLVMSHPTTIKFDRDGNIHGENCLAWEYEDGTGVGFWHGTQIPDEWMQGKLPSPWEALQLRNVELRRCACEIIGWDSILDALQAIVIDTNPNPEIGILVEVLLPSMQSITDTRWGTSNFPDKARFLRVRCGTGREFALPVPPEMTTALEANAWTYGVDPSEYKPVIRT